MAIDVVMYCCGTADTVCSIWNINKLQAIIQNVGLQVTASIMHTKSILFPRYETNLVLRVDQFCNNLHVRKGVPSSCGTINTFSPPTMFIRGLSSATKRSL